MDAITAFFAKIRAYFSIFKRSQWRRAPSPHTGSKCVRGLNMAQLYMQGLRRVLNV